MAGASDAIAALTRAPSSPADELAATCASTDLKAFADSGFDVDCVQVYAFRNGQMVAGWTAIARKREGH
jgi:hypothetical protein